MSDRGHETPQASGLPAAAALLAGSVLASRLLGYAREALLANRVGVGIEADAYQAAFQIPDMLNYFLAGGALSVAFLPAYTRLRSGGRDAEAERFFATVLGTLGTIALLATLGLWLAAEPLVARLFGFDAAGQRLTLQLTRIVLPAQIFFITGGIVQATLLARGRFLAQALAPLLYNGGILLGGWLLAPRLGVAGFAWGALAGAIAGPWLVPLLDARRRVRLRLRFAPFDPEFRRYLLLAAPLMFGVTLLTVDEWYDRVVGSYVAEGVVSQLVYARRLLQAPVAAVGQAIGAALLPTLAHLWAERRGEEGNRVLETTLRTGLGLAILAGAATFAFARPLVELVYHHGAFTHADAERVSFLLQVFAFAVPAWVGQQILVRAFYARGDMWRPMALGTAVALAMLPLYVALGRELDATGLALAGALGMSVNALATLAWARRRHGAPSLAALGASVGRALPVAAGAAWVGTLAVQGRAGASGALLDLAAGGALFAGVAGVGVIVAGDAPLRDALRRLARRLTRRGAA